MHARPHLAAAALAVALAVSGCGDAKADCHQLELRIGATQRAFEELEGAARRGDRAKFEATRKEVQTQLGQVEALTFTADKGFVAESNVAERARYIAAMPRAVEGMEKLLAALEANPELGKKYFEGRIPVDPAYEEAVTDVQVAGAMKCN